MVSPVSADDYSDGEAAFAAQDYTSAAEYWRKAARDGSAQAHLQLGLLADVGLGMPRQPTVAFEHYMNAAQMGVPEARFNVGVMLDAGVGTRRDSVAAIVWYARAALDGNDRAAFNLGLLYRDGIGIPTNLQLAAHWLGAAAPALPAAENARQRLQPESQGSMTAPVPLSASVSSPDGATVDLVWTALPGPEQSSFAVQILSFDTSDSATAAMWNRETAASALRVAVPEGGLIWRVSRIDLARHHYKASPWQQKDTGADRPEPTGLVSIVVAEGDTRAAARAGDLARTLRSNGLSVRLSNSVEPIGSSAILYRYVNDAELARNLAGFLPGFTTGSVRQSDALQAGPGEVVISLVLAPPDRVTVPDKDQGSPRPESE